MQDVKNSIVIASFSSINHLNKCLSSLKKYIPDLDNKLKFEIIVSSIFTESEVASLKKIIDFQLISNSDERKASTIASRETRVFRLRTIGVKAAQGKRILLLEDHCEVTQNWFKSMQSMLDSGNCFAGGPVANGSSNTLYQWSLYWSEYAAIMPPLPSNEVSYVSAVNCGYHKESLEQCFKTWQHGFYDNEVHDALTAQGTKQSLASEAIINTSLPFAFKQALVHLFTGGKRYGGYRGGQCWNFQRIIRLCSTLIVPAVLLLRVLKLVRTRQPQHLITFCLASPIFYLLLGAWGFGELVGTLLGKNKESLQ